MPTATPGGRDPKADKPYRSSAKVSLYRHQRQHQHQHQQNIHSTAIPKYQQAEAHKMLTIYRDDTPGACIAGVSGAIVDLKLPVLYRRDLKLLMRYPEPRRTATWIQMSFVADDNYMASSGVLYKAYFDALTPLKNDLDRRTPPTTPTTLLLSPNEFFATLGKQIEGCEPYLWTGKDGTEERSTRGVRARKEALTFPSTNRKRNRRQLQYYKKKGDLVYPEGDPKKRSTFAKWLAHDPLFMLPSETQSPLVDRMRAGSARSEGGTYYDGKETEDAGFPGISIEKKSLKSKATSLLQDGKSTSIPGGAAAVGVGQTDAEFEASLRAEFMAAVQEQSNKLKNKTTREDPSSTSWTKESKLLPARTSDQTDAQVLAALNAHRKSTRGSELIERKAKEQDRTQDDQETIEDHSAGAALQRFAADIG
jgi:hypothetical protein